MGCVIEIGVGTDPAPSETCGRQWWISPVVGDFFRRDAKGMTEVEGELLRHERSPRPKPSMIPMPNHLNSPRAASENVQR